MLGKLDQIVTQTGFIAVDQVFFSLYLIELAELEIIQKVHGAVYIFTKFSCHTAHSTVTLSECKCRVVKKTLLKKIKVCFIFQVFRTVFNEPAYKLLQFRDKWKQNTDCYKTENRI